MNAWMLLGQPMGAHTVGNAVVAAYQRSSMLDLRRPVLQKWADYVCGDNVIDI